MAFPTILIDSATGSDTAASGAGPGTALTGTAATSDGAGTTVTLDGAPDLSGVATDGSAALFLAESVAGRRCFSRITAVDNGLKTVTVSPAVRASIPGGDSIDWAIGGKRASFGGTDTRKLAENNSAAGDAMPGWTIEFQSGHTETIASTIRFRRSGDTTDGPITLRGALNAVTMPVITGSNNGVCIMSESASFLAFEEMEFRNSNGTKTASIALSCFGGARVKIRKVYVKHATNNFWKAFVTGGDYLIVDCEVANCASDGIDASDIAGGRIVSNWIHNNSGRGISSSANTSNPAIIGNIIANNGSDGIFSSNDGTGGGANCHIVHNTINNNTGDGIQLDGTGDVISGLILNNNITNNGGYGIRMPSTDDDFLRAHTLLLAGNNHYLNTSGFTNVTSLSVDRDTSNLNPQYVDAANGNYAIGTNLKAKGFPVGGSLAIGVNSATYSYVDPGAAQRQEAGGGASLGMMTGGRL